MFRVIGVPEFDSMMDELNARAKKGDQESVQLLKLIDKGIEKLKYDFKYGDHIAQKKIPHEYIDKYQVVNLWKLNLNSFWRLIYTVKGTEVEVISVMLEVLDHKEYDRKFHYKTS